MAYQNLIHNLKTDKFRAYTHVRIGEIDPIQRLPKDMQFEMSVVANVLPFRVNNYVIDELIDWDRVSDDPVFQLTFPQKDMLEPAAFNQMADLLKKEASPVEIHQLAQKLRADMNPHPAGQLQMNVPSIEDEPLDGIQHKYDQTVLFFPSQGQICHSYCTFCFRWAQFVGGKELKFSANQSKRLQDYLKRHKEVTDLLVTGGDPMVMKVQSFKKYLNFITEPEFDHIQTLRIGTKALTFWPHRFVNDADADDLLRFLESLVKAGKHVAIMAHLNHWQEVDTPVAKEAIRRILDTGAVIRTQAPLLRHINDSADIWAHKWQEEVKHGMIPYYMFVERDTGARRYFELPLSQAAEIYRDARLKVSGLARTARGPSMSAGPGKVEIQGVTEIHGEKVFMLRFIQARNSEWVQRPFFAKYDETSHWLDQLQPALGETEFFYEKEYREMQKQLKVQSA